MAWIKNYCDSACTNAQVACKLIPTTPSGTVIAPLYGIIAPTHDFKKVQQGESTIRIGCKSVVLTCDLIHTQQNLICEIQAIATLL